MLASFEIGRPDNRVEYDIWYSSSSQRALDFIVDFQKIDELFDRSVLMTPHFKFWECKDCDSDFTSENCWANGKYCAIDSNHPTLSGRDIMTEDLRQLCVYNIAYLNQVNLIDLETQNIKNNPA